MTTTKWILACALAVFMTAATIRAQKDTYEDTGKSSAELDMLVDLAELDLLADMLESLLREDENAESNPIADFQMPEDGLAGMPGMGIDICGGGFGMGSMGMEGGSFPVIAGFSGMGGFGTMSGFSGFPIMAGYGGIGGFCGF